MTRRRARRFQKYAKPSASLLYAAAAAATAAAAAAAGRYSSMPSARMRGAGHAPVARSRPEAAAEAAAVATFAGCGERAYTELQPRRVDVPAGVVLLLLLMLLLLLRLLLPPLPRNCPSNECCGAGVSCDVMLPSCHRIVARC